MILPMLKPLRDHTPNHIAANKEGTTDLEMKASIIATSGGSIDIHPGIELFRN